MVCMQNIFNLESFSRFCKKGTLINHPGVLPKHYPLPRLLLKAFRLNLLADDTGITIKYTYG